MQITTNDASRLRIVEIVDGQEVEVTPPAPAVKNSRKPAKKELTDDQNTP